MTRRNVHTVPNGDDGWINRTEGSSRGIAPAPTKAEAQASGRESTIKSGGEHVVHNKNGQIASKNTYPRSSDPRSSKG
jgi:hypothetical protein